MQRLGRRGWRAFAAAGLTLAVLVLGSSSAGAQQPARGAESAKGQAPAPPAADQPLPITTAEVSSVAQTALNELRRVEADTDVTAVLTSARAETPALTDEVEQIGQQSLTNRLTDSSLAELQALDTRLRQAHTRLRQLQEPVKEQASRLSATLAELDTQRVRWQHVIDVPRTPPIPDELITRAKQVVGSYDGSTAMLQRRQSALLAEQERFAALGLRLTESAQQLSGARAQLLRRLLIKDQPPLWRLEQSVGLPTTQDAKALVAPLLDLQPYLNAHSDRLLLALAVTALLAAALNGLGRRVALERFDPPQRGQVNTVFEQSVAAALGVVALTIGAFDQDAPPALAMLLRAVTLCAAVWLVRARVDVSARRMLGALFLLYLFDQLRGLSEPLPVTGRLLIVFEMLAATLLASYAALHCRALAQHRNAAGWRRLGHIATLIAAALLLAALAAVAGYVGLTDLISRIVLDGAYLAVILYGAALVWQALGASAIAALPLLALRSGRIKAIDMLAGLRRLLIVVAGFAWVWMMFDTLGLRDRVQRAALWVYQAGMQIGPISLRIGDLVVLALACWLPARISRLTRLVLEEEVYRRVTLPGGLANAISTTAHYLLIVAGALIGLAAIGVDMTKLTILVGALTVGIGFGLQNIINNFVSGLILLFERPIKLGDLIQIDDAAGTVTRIGIRATVIRTIGGAEIIVPNGSLISARVTNWTRLTRQRLIELPVSVVAEADTQTVIELLIAQARANRDIKAAPTPDVLLTRLTPDAQHFELRAFTDRAEDWMRVRSALALSIKQALAAAGIALRPLP